MNQCIQFIWFNLNYIVHRQSNFLYIFVQYYFYDIIFIGLDRCYRTHSMSHIFNMHLCTNIFNECIFSNNIHRYLLFGGWYLMSNNIYSDYLAVDLIALSTKSFQDAFNILCYFSHWFECKERASCQSFDIKWRKMIFLIHSCAFPIEWIELNAESQVQLNFYHWIFGFSHIFYQIISFRLNGFAFNHAINAKILFVTQVFIFLFHLFCLRFRKMKLVCRLNGRKNCFSAH